MGGEDVAGVVDMVDIEHDEARRDRVGRLTRAVTCETAGMWCDDRQLTFEAGKFLGILTVEEFDLVADMLNAWILHGGFYLVPDNRCWLASGYR